MHDVEVSRNMTPIRNRHEWTRTVLTPWVPGGPAVPFVALAALLALAGCQSSSRELLGPSGAKCQISVPANVPPLSADGGAGSVAITAERECAWSVASDAPWITITSGRTGQGAGVVNYTAAGNPAPTARRAALTIADRQVEVVQEPAPCQFTFTPSGLTADPDGGDSVVAVSTLAGCAWNAISDASWISIAPPADGNGTGTMQLLIEPNTGSGRTGHIRVGGRTYVVTQPGANGPACAVTPASTGQSIGAAGGPVSIGVSAPPGCAWTATSHAPWIAVGQGAEGEGDGTVELNVSANGGPQRAGIVRIGSQTVTVTQAGGTATPSCSYSLSASQQSVTAAGGSVSVTVSTSGACAWTAATQVPWISVTAGAQSAGEGTVTMSVAPNIGADRSGVVSVAGQSFTVSQSGATSTPSCSYSLGSTQRSAGSGGGPLTVNVSTSSGCAWAATSLVSWIAVTSGAAGVGSGQVGLAVAANGGAQRSGVVNIAGRTFTVTQAAAPSPACAYSLSDAGESVAATGGTVSVGVTATAGCAWTATSQAGWITVTSGAQGTGNGTVGLRAAANLGGQRSGTVTIAGQTFTVTQGAAPASCTYSISPTQQAVPALGGTFSVAVTTQAGCAWTARADAGWIEITSSTSGTGTGTVTYRVGTGLVLFSREGTMTVAGQTLAVNQAGLLINEGDQSAAASDHDAPEPAAATKGTP